MLSRETCKNGRLEISWDVEGASLIGVGISKSDSEIFQCLQIFFDHGNIVYCEGSLEISDRRVQRAKCCQRDTKEKNRLSCISKLPF